MLLQVDLAILVSAVYIHRTDIISMDKAMGAWVQPFHSCMALHALMVRSELHVTGVDHMTIRTVAPETI